MTEKRMREIEKEIKTIKCLIAHTRSKIYITVLEAKLAALKHERKTIQLSSMDLA